MALELKRKKKQQQELSQRRQQLEEESVINQTLKDQIDKEVKNSAILEVQYQKRIRQLQGTATSLCKLTQIEKKKNVLERLSQNDLKTIIDHLSKRHNTDGNEKVEDLSKKLHKLEYDYDQIVQKQNESHAQINELKERVNAARTERVIYSGVFKNIEREIRASQEDFKILLIERFNAEKRREQAERQYKKNRQDAVKRNLSSIKANLRSAKELENKITSNRDISYSSTGAELKNAIAEAAANYQDSSTIFKESNSNKKFIELEKEGGSHTTFNKKGMGTNYKSETMNSYQITLNKIKSDTGVELNELLLYVENIEQINNQLFQESNRLINQIDQTQHKIISLRCKKYFRKSQNPEKPKTTSRIRMLEDSLQQVCCNLNGQDNELTNLLNNQEFLKVLNFLKIQLNPEENGNQVPNLMNQISERISSNLITCNTDREGVYDCRQDMKEDQLVDLIYHSDKNKECQKILLRKEMQQSCQRQINQIKDKLGKKTLNKQTWKKKKLL